ncbi:hypothetical protein P3T73_13650 [Kiritimatiellota bacterium B12222]|nr:hypothetical protein P3T73_13650 [Kiritimatiellota bacterium B12222]
MHDFEWIPTPLKNTILRTRNQLRKVHQQRVLTSLDDLACTQLIIGAAGTRYEGWVATDKETLNLLDQESWMPLLSLESIDALLAEHIWEHLHPQEAITAAMTCYAFLKPGGHLRVAVPDGLQPRAAYIDAVKPGGTGLGAEDHKVLYTYASFRDLFEGVGFEVRLLEYFDEQGHFHCAEWDPAEGMIQRSKRFDARNAEGGLVYTSLILDAVKPQEAS